MEIFNKICYPTNATVMGWPIRITILSAAPPFIHSLHCLQTMSIRDKDRSKVSAYFSLVSLSLVEYPSSANFRLKFGAVQQFRVAYFYFVVNV